MTLLIMPLKLNSNEPVLLAAPITKTLLPFPGMSLAIWHLVLLILSINSLPKDVSIYVFNLSLNTSVLKVPQLGL